MASLTKHPKGHKIRFYLYLPDGSKEERYRYRQKKQEALALKQDADLLEAATRRGRITREELVYFRHSGLITEDEARLITGGKDLSPVTWETLRKDYERYSLSAHSAHTRKTVRSRLDKLIEHFGELPLQAVSVHTILDWQASRIETLAAKTVKHERDVLNQLLDLAVDSGAIPCNPGRHRLLRGTLRLDRSRLPVALTYDQVKALLTALNSEMAIVGGQGYLAALLCLFAGLRRGELTYLTYDDINGRDVIIQGKSIGKDETTDRDVLDTGRWTPKSNRPRVVELPDKVSNRVAKLLRREGRFVLGGGKTYHRDYISQEFDRVLKKISPALSLHCLRHTFVTWRIEHGLSGKGDNLVRVQQAAGHADIQTTMRYTHIKSSPEKNFLGLVK